MRLAAFYHCFADAAWQEPTTEYLQTLHASDFPACLHVGLVGSPRNREQARAAIGDCIVVAEVDTGHEQVTLAAVREYAQHNDGAVMYAHTKGASDPTQFRSDWRRSMCLRVIDNWRSNLDALEQYDAVGCHWLTSNEFPGQIRTPFFAGNYWMARCDYLQRLPECSEDDRMDAELWIGLENPRALDLLPGWPNESLFTILRTEVYG